MPHQDVLIEAASHHLGPVAPEPDMCWSHTFFDIYYLDPGTYKC